MSNCLLESTFTRKNKITLTDYDYLKDIQNRLLLASLSEKEIGILEEILYSSLRTPIKKLANNLDLEEAVLLPTLEKLLPSGLFTIEEGSLIIDKEMRKYFELEIQKFEEDFVPGMEFVQGLLRKVPIHVLPIWYATSRTSSNIFASIIEKNLETPQTFIRYVADLNFGEPILQEIIGQVFEAEDFSIPTKTILQKYNLSKEILAEYMLHLEFSFVCCTVYKKTKGAWEEHITPFHEWKEYLSFLKETTVNSIPLNEVVPTKAEEFAFALDCAQILTKAQKEPLPPTIFNTIYLQKIETKLALLQLISNKAGKIEITPAGEKWLNLPLESQALYFYRHPLNRPFGEDFPETLITEKSMREAEKSILRVLDKDWVLFEEFSCGILAALSEEKAVSLQKTGRTWKYTLPTYSSEEKAFLKAVVMEWLFEPGIVQTGVHHGRECFRVTNFGKTLFAR